jgi:hypothetical protein
MKMKLGISYVGLAALTEVLLKLVQEMKHFIFWPSKEVTFR